MSSLVIVTVSGVPMTANPREGFSITTWKVSFASIWTSPAISTVKVWLVWPAVNVSVPLGSRFPAKSLAVAAFAPELTMR